MVGAYTYGSSESFFKFLNNNGYNITKEQQEEIVDNGTFEDIIEMFNFQGMEINIVNGGAGHDFMIGYTVKNKSPQSHKPYIEKFAQYFPHVKAEYVEFTQT